MSIDIISQIEALKNAKDTWINSISKQPEPNNLFELNIGINDISLVFDEIIRLLNFVNNNDINPVEWYSLKNRLDDAISSFTSNQRISSLGFVATTPYDNKVNSQKEIQKICSSLQHLKNGLIFLVPVNPEIETLSPGFSHEMNAKIVEVKEWFQELNSIRSNIEGVKTNASQAFKTIELEKERSEKVMKDVQDILARIEGYERETGNAKTNADSSASSAKASSESVSKLTKDLEDSIEEKNNLFKEFEAHRDHIKELLVSANQVGLAGSFQIKRQQRRWMVILWAFIFWLGIALLCFLGYKEILPLVKTNADPLTIGSHFFLAAPVIWLTWFAARQYGHSSLIYEDYAFKESTAMAFVGYRNEMGQDPDMLKLLQESAIQNFAANPTRLILKNADPASPAHALLDKSAKMLKQLNLLSKRLTSDKDL